MSLTLVTAAPVRPISESEVWDHLRLNLDQYGTEPHDRTHVASLISAATAHLDGRDGILGRCLVPQVWDLSVDQFPSGNAIELRLPPIISIVSVSYIDADGATQVMDAADYVLSADKASVPKLRLAYNANWPTTRYQCDAVTVRMLCGYDSGNSPQDASGVPEAIKHAMLLLIAHWYEHREPVNVGSSVTEVPRTVDALLAPYRLLGCA